MQRANIALALAATLGVGCTELQDMLGDLTHGGGHGPSHPHGGPPAPPPPAPSCGPTVDADALYTLLARDLSSLDADDQPFQRYVTLANQRNAGECGAALDDDRAAISELFNSLSLDATLSRPVAIDADALTFRVDLRDYTWDRELSVDGRVFADAWEAVVASSPYALEYTGPDADDAKADAGTPVPLLSFDALAAVATQSSLYYALTDVPGSSDALLESLGVDLAANRRDGEAVLAGTTRSRISRADRLVERHALEVRAGFFWRALDFLDESSVSIFEDPLSLEHDGSVALFTLPNGLLGYALFDGEGGRRDDSEILLDTNQNDFRARVASSCLNCHGPVGVLPVLDEVRDVVLANADELDGALVADVERLFPPADELASVLDADALSYANARATAGLPADGPDPLASALLGFDQDVSRERMAGDLWVPRSAIAENLDELPLLFSLPFASREEYSSAYGAAVCSVVATRNRPVVCS